MAKYHISPKTGDPAVCRAHERPCPVKNPETGETDEHFSSRAEAEQAANERLQKSHDLLPTRVKKTVPSKGVTERTHSRDGEGNPVVTYRDSANNLRRAVTRTYHEETLAVEEALSEEKLTALREEHVPAATKAQVETTYVKDRQGNLQRRVFFRGVTDEPAYSVKTSSGREVSVGSFEEGRQQVAEHFRGLGFDPDEEAYSQAMAAATPEELSQVVGNLERRYPLNDSLTLS